MSSGGVLILGASALQVPAIEAARKLGLRVGVLDQDPSAPGRSLADAFFHVSTMDSEGVLQAARAFDPEGLMTMATDAPMMVVAEVTSELGLPGPGTAQMARATDKILMAQAFRSGGVPAPEFWEVGDEDELAAVAADLPFPCIAKPADSSGSRGVVRVETVDELRGAFNYSVSQSRTGRVIVQELLEGREVSVEGMVLAGQLHVVAVTDKETTGAPHFVETAHQQPANLPSHLLSEVREVSLLAVAAIGIDDGPVHIELICTAERVMVIELGARLGGDFITSHLVPLSTGVDLVSATIRQACGLPFNIEPTVDRGSAISYFYAQESGVLRRIEGLIEASATPGVASVHTFKQLGECVGPLHGSGDRVGAVVTCTENPGNALDLARSVISHITLEVDRS